MGAMLDDLDTGALRDLMQAHLDEGSAVLRASGTAFAGHDAEFELDMAYLGQTHTVQVPLSVTLREGEVQTLTLAAIRDAFERTYRGLYGRTLGNPVRVLNLRSAVIGRREKFDLASLAPGPEASLAAARQAPRPVYAEGAWHDAQVFDRLALPVGAALDGPAILQQPDATIFVDPGLRATVDAHGNVILSRTGPTATEAHA
jgi:N-methylhydantoinase A